MPRRKGSLVVVGTGIEALGQMTEDARREIRRAERLFFIADALGERTIRSLNKRGRSLFDLYAAGKHRLKTYAQMVERVLAEVRLGHRVCLALYGHPGVFAMPAHAAVRIARQEGYPAEMLPGVSADACLIADLGVDPGATGWQSYEATDYLLRHRRADPAVGLVLWQVGVVGRLDFAEGPVDRAKLEVLTEALLEIHPRNHLATVYEASTLPGFPPSIHKIRIGSVHLAEVSRATTLYVPPSRETPIDPAMLARLGIRPEDRIHCLR
ncbi:MAG TPA: SAM-dependent methyltransferase [Myxococcales bacterium]|jgi:precorrin-6B methylase 1|nr:SAM-dependent methyltransferase [Myxococcales bacterium]